MPHVIRSAIEKRLRGSPIRIGKPDSLHVQSVEPEGFRVLVGRESQSRGLLDRRWFRGLIPRGGTTDRGGGQSDPYSHDEPGDKVGDSHVI